jgi:glycyl-tRNA synthetase beta chain
VILPRLADASFFWETDQKVSLADRLETLDRVVYQKGLGSIGDKSRRVAALASTIAESLGEEPGPAERAGLLAKCDLVSGMVGEFPELQGTMGGYYAKASGELPEVALAISEHYRPRFSGDVIASSVAGCSVALADKLDTLSGIFCLGKKPSGNRDPFALRRNALGIVRTIVEGRLDMDIRQTIAASVAAQPVRPEKPVEDEIYDFLVERLRAYAADRLAVATEVFEAVLDRRPASLLDFVERLLAVQAFVELDEAASLAAANKRIGNILRQAGFDGGSVKQELLEDAAEKLLADAVTRAKAEVEPLIEAGEYRLALEALARLRETVDRFFDDVMVMADEQAIRDNRLALLGSLGDLFLQVADISRLAIR